MMNMLSAHEIYKLAEELNLPLVVRGCLTDGLTDDNRMLVASLLTDMRKDQLLLSLACSLRIIAEHKQDEPEIARSLIYHADYILDDYAPHWRANKNSVFPSEWALHVEEDLEHVHELLMLTRDAFAFRDDVIYTLCDMLADYTKDQLNQGEFEITERETNLVMDINLTSHMPSNVIMFPMDRVRG